MTTESIVLPLPESRALAEAGIVLDTAMVWVRDNDDQHISVVERSRTEAILDLKGEVTVLCGAWVLSELLDAIRARCSGSIGFAHFHDLNGQYVWQVWWGESERLATGQAHGEGKSYLLAASALLREVSHV